MGHSGFVGSSLLRQRSFSHLYRSTDIGQIAGGSFDTVVCADAPAQKWVANREPDADRARIEALIGHLRTVRCRSFVLISTVDVFQDSHGVDEATAVDEHPYLQSALVALDPRNGYVRAPVGGRDWNHSNVNRATQARRQPGSAFKPFVYLAAFESAAADGLTDITPATLVNDEQSTFAFDDQGWTPRNYEDEYDGLITLRRALAMSRNVATVRVAELAGFDRVADLWKRVGSSMVPKPYPSIALGVFEATPLEIATAYTVFPNGGEVRPLRSIARLESGGVGLPLKADKDWPAFRDMVTERLQHVIQDLDTKFGGFEQPVPEATDVLIVGVGMYLYNDESDDEELFTIGSRVAGSAQKS